MNLFGRTGGPELERRALEHLRQRLGQDGPPEQRLVHCDVREEWDARLLRQTSQHSIHVLGRSADLVFYFDSAAQPLGWRDDGRVGSKIPAVLDREFFQQRVSAELNLPSAARLGRVEPAQLPPVGWTHQGVFFLSSRPRENEVLRVWVEPVSYRVIQCLHGSPAPAPMAPRRDATALKQVAARNSGEVLSRRLTTAKLPAANPEQYFQIDPGEPESYEGGAQVRVHTWRLWSEALVTFDIATGEVVADRIDRFAAPPTQAELTQKEALAKAATQVQVPADAQLEAFEHYQTAPRHRLARLLWKRIHQGFRVEGDHLELSLHPQTLKLVSFDRKWRALRLKELAHTLSESAAVAFVRDRQSELEIDPDMKIQSAELVIVEHKKDRSKPGSAEDRVAWIVEMACSWGWVQARVDASSREVLDIIRSS